MFAPWPGVGRVYITAQTASLRTRVWRLNSGHRPRPRGVENARALQFAAVEHHPGETRQVGRRGEQAGMAGHAAHPPSSWIMHLAAQHLVAQLLRWRDAIELV